MRPISVLVPVVSVLFSLSCEENLEKTAVRAPGGAAGALPDGAGGAETGGATSSSGGQTAGSGGVSSGGQSSGGSTGAGGSAASATGGAGAADAGTEPVDASGPDPSTVGVVGCKDQTCTSAEVCCYTPATLLPPVLSSFTCSDKPCGGTEVAVSCDGAEDCDPGKKCCRVDTIGGILGQTTPSYTCRDSCTVATIACGGPDNCVKGTVCCETVGLAGSLGTACQATCSGLGLYVLCRKNSDCPSLTPTCAESTSLPGFMRCQ
ncbi:MAG TPA: hypothetical protein VHE30_05625 [Polyangiaceae bacterium]|nr:hypothetical protein [Polyangiaceae bacterium]